MVSTVIRPGGGGGALKIAAKVDGTTAVFADKSALDTYTTTHPSWANNLPANQAVVLGVDDEKVDYAYVRRDGEWIDVTTNFIGSSGPKGETVKITSVTNTRTGKELTTTVALDDGTSATSVATDIGYVASVVGQDPNEQGDISITPENIGAYTTVEVDAAISASADTINASIDELTETVDQNAPYRHYTSLSDIDVTLEDLDSINNDQIRINNFFAVINAMGAGTEASFSVSADERISPINYSRLEINAHDINRASATAISKSTSDVYVISGSAGDPDSCQGWVRIVNETNLKANANIDQVSAEGNLTLKSNGSAVIIAGTGGVDVRNRKVKNALNATNPQDLTTLTQSEHMLDEAFSSATLASVDKPEYEIDLRDLDKSGGYGQNGTTVTYVGLQNGNFVPDSSVCKWWFVHEDLNTTLGWHILHKSLLPEAVQSNLLAFFQLNGTAKGALGKSNQNSTSTAADGIWDSNGRLIPNTENANDQTHSEYLDKDGNVVTNASDALAATYSAGAMSVIGPPLMYKGYVVYSGDGNPTTFVADGSSEWFVFKGKTGGGTFGTIKGFMNFPRDYTALSYITETAAEALGIKVSANAAAIRELQERVEAIETDFVRKDEIEDAIEDAADGIIDTELQNRMQSTKIDYDDSIDKLIPLASSTFDSLQVLYRIKSGDGNYKESGVLHIYRLDDSFAYAVDAVQRPTGDVPTEFSAHLDTGSIVLKLHNTGAGNGASITYRNNLFSELRTTA